MRYEQSKIGQVLILKVKEDHIAADNASRLKSDLIGFVKSGSRQIALDVSEVSFIDSSGLGALIATRKVIGDGGGIVISNALPAVVCMFELTRMDRVFRLVRSTEEAVSSFQAVEEPPERRSARD